MLNIFFYIINRFGGKYLLDCSDKYVEEEEAKCRNCEWSEEFLELFMGFLLFQLFSLH